MAKSEVPQAKKGKKVRKCGDPHEPFELWADPKKSGSAGVRIPCIPPSRKVLSLSASCACVDVRLVAFLQRKNQLSAFFCPTWKKDTKQF